MSLQNQLPANYAKALTSVISGKKKYSTVFNQIFERLNPAYVKSISRDMRESLWNVPSNVPEGWWVRTISRLEGHEIKNTEFEPEQAALFSVSGDGYIRELAVREWQRVHNSFELALLLLRLNDWVEQVRSAAIAKLEKLMKQPESQSGLTGEVILGCMELILDPKRFGRSREIEFRVLNQLLNLNNIPNSLASHVTNSPRDNAPRYIKLALKRGVLIDMLPNIAVNGKHPEVRRVAYRALLNSSYSWNENNTIKRREISSASNQIELAKAALDDKSAAVKSVALEYIAEFKPQNLFSETTFRKFLSHKRYSVVDRAIYGLKVLGINYIDELREKISQGDISLRSLELLGRHGVSSDGELIYHNLEHFSEMQKIQALGAAAKLGHRKSVDDLEKIAFYSEDTNSARRATNTLYYIDFYTPNSDAIIKFIQEGQNLAAKGYLRLVSNLPTMKLALVLSELHIADPEAKYLNLWDLVRKKRNTGAFLPSENEVLSLKKSVMQHEDLKVKFFEILGLNL